jgi:hypothetical protein
MTDLGVMAWLIGMVGPGPPLELVGCSPELNAAIVVTRTGIGLQGGRCGPPGRQA